MLRWKRLSFFSGNACGKNKKKLFVFPRKLNYGKLRTNPSGNEVLPCEVRDPLGSKISAVGRAKLSKRNYPVEELYPRNYRRGIIRKLRRIKLLGWALSTTCCCLKMATALKKGKHIREEFCWRIVLETVWSRQEYKNTNIFRRKSFPSLHPWRSVTPSSSNCSQDSVRIPITDSHADQAGQLFLLIFWKYRCHRYSGKSEIPISWGILLYQPILHFPFLICRK